MYILLYSVHFYLCMFVCILCKLTYFMCCQFGVINDDIASDACWYSCIGLLVCSMEHPMALLKTSEKW